MKVVMAVRGPIAQNLLLFFQLSTRLCFCDIPEYWKDGGDIQILWDSWIGNVLQDELPFTKECVLTENKIEFLYMDQINKFFNNIIVVQNFFEKNFEKYNGIDVYNYSFDREKGYTIIQDEDIEIFIYQLEKSRS